MAKKRNNPLSGMFHDPPKEADTPIPDQPEQDMAPVEPPEAPKPVAADTPAPEQATQGEAPAEPPEAPAEPKAADAPTPEQADQSEAPAEPPEVPAEPAAADVPTPEQADQGEAPAEPPEVPAEPAVADAPAPERADQGEAPAEPPEAPAEPAAADAPAQEQADQGEAPAEPPEAPAEPAAADAPTPEQANQGEAPAEPSEAPAEPVAADAPTPEQTDQGEAPAEPSEPPVEPKAADAPTPEQADQGEPPAEPPEAPVGPEAADAPTPTPEKNGPQDIRFVKIADIKPLAGTYVKDFPREDYSELTASIKEHGLEKPIILREGANGDFQLVDGFHRCEALKRAGFLEVKAEVYDMTPLEASRYRRDHRNNPDLPIPGKLIPAHPSKEEPAVEADAPDHDEENFEIPKNFTLPITKPGQAEIITTLKVADIHPFEGHPFLVKDNKDMFDLVESVKLYGVLEPVMVINRPAGGYEMVSGHRRMRACQLAGIETIPTIVRNLDRDEAIIAMVDANLKRETISPMEKARAYKMKTEAMRRKVGRRSKAEAATGEKPLSADEELAKQVGESVATVQRYKQLNQLDPALQEMVDKGKIPVNTAADIALLKKDEQKELANAIQKEDKVPTGAQAKEMKKQSKEGTLTTEAIKQTVAPTKREENPPLKVTLVEEDLRPYFPDKRTTTPDVKKAIFEALALRQKLQERQKAQAQKTAAPKEEAKPPDKPAAGGDQKSIPPASEPTDKPPASKTPAPKTGNTKKPTPGKKPAKPKKNTPAR